MNDEPSIPMRVIELLKDCRREIEGLRANVAELRSQLGWVRNVVYLLVAVLAGVGGGEGVRGLVGA